MGGDDGGGRDFLITGLRLMATARGQVLPAEQLGKHKTAWQIITVIFFLVLLSAEELKYLDRGSSWWIRGWNQAGPTLVWITVLLTVYSASWICVASSRCHRDRPVGRKSEIRSTKFETNSNLKKEEIIQTRVGSERFWTAAAAKRRRRFGSRRQ